MMETESKAQSAELLDAFKAGLEAIGTTDQPGDPASDPVAWTLALAALCGPFDVHRLVRFARESEQMMLVTELINRTEGLTVNGCRRRLLEITTRRRILADLLTRPGLLQSLLNSFAPAREDAQGRVLRKLFAGWRPDLRRLRAERLGILCIALGWLQGLAPSKDANGQDVLPWPQIGEVQREQARRGRNAEIRSLLSGGMVGRESDLHKLLAFVDSPETAGGIMIVTGAGGIGKSTLVARLASALGARKHPTPVLNFDFDRPALDPVGPGLTLELTRQLAQHLPQSADALSEARTLIRETFERGGGQSDRKQSAETSAVSSSGEAGLMIGREIIDTDFTGHPVLVLLDSFEMAAAQGHTAVTALRDWLAYLTQDVGMHGVRAIVVGRAAESAANLLRVGESAIYRLGPLTPPNAIRMLKQSGLDEKRAVEVASSLGGNPLVLRLASRYLLEHPEVSGDALLEGGEVDEALTQGVLYRRILNRVGNGDHDPLRKLAYPGLALRVITPGLLRDVLAPIVLKNSVHGAKENAALFERLAQQVWLVDQESERRVRHRRDLREITLRLLRNDSAVGPLVDELHSKAIAYYTNTRDPDLPADRARLELVYHRLMLLAPDEDLPTSEHSLVNFTMAGEFDELPPHTAALARFHSGQRPTVDDLKFLPEVYQRSATAEVAWAAIDTGRPEDALALYQDQLPVPVWHLTALHDTVQWRLPPYYLDLEYRVRTANEPTTQSRERFEEARTVTAFLHLWRGEFHEIESPADDELTKKRSLSTGTAHLRAAAAWGVGALLDGKIKHPGWLAMREMLGPGFKLHPKDAMKAKAEARLWLLLWKAGYLKPDDRIPILADSLALTPKLSSKLARLWDDFPDARRDQELRLGMKIRLPAPVAMLTGKVARNVENVIQDDQVNLRSNLEAAGFRPEDFLPGLMTELQPATRRMLRLFIADERSREAFAHYLHKDPHSPLPDFTPSDLKLNQWFKAASEGDGLRATLPLIEWCGRLGQLSYVCSLAAKISGGETGHSLHELAHAWRRLEAVCARQTNYIGR
ncbi:AAA family ATPase [Pseudomonas sp. M20]|uniref:AAA family ATPase n=1 Tax=Pseudomonas sp. M20 TaxID=3379129 RepID=UPI003867D4D5